MRGEESMSECAKTPGITGPKGPRGWCIFKLPCGICKIDKEFCRSDIGYVIPKTNADRLRQMSDEELAVFIRDQIIDRNIGIPTEAWLSWLKSPVEPGEVDNGT